MASYVTHYNKNVYSEGLIMFFLTYIWNVIKDLFSVYFKWQSLQITWMYKAQCKEKFNLTKGMWTYCCLCAITLMNNLYAQKLQEAWQILE